MIEFNFEDDELGLLVIEVEGNVFRFDVEDSSELGYHFERCVENLHCMIYKDKELLHPDNIKKEILNEIYEKAEVMLIDYHMGYEL